MNKTTIKKKHKTHKNNIQYRKLRRWVLPAVLGAALSTLAFIPTFAAETQANTNVAVVTTTEQAPTVPSAQGSNTTKWCSTWQTTCRQPPVGTPKWSASKWKSKRGTSNRYAKRSPYWHGTTRRSRS